MEKKETQTTSDLGAEQNLTTEDKDSFKIPVKRSPIFMFAMLQIPLVIIMVLTLYYMYQSSKPD